jgi:hypothetical protein
MFRSPEDRVVMQNQLVERKIPLQANPKPVTLGDPTFYVVTAENFDEFLERYVKEEGEPWVFYAMSVRSYETLALNVAETRRYLEQQKQIIIYYESAISGKKEEKKEEEVITEK